MGIRRVSRLLSISLSTMLLLPFTVPATSIAAEDATVSANGASAGQGSLQKAFEAASQEFGVPVEICWGYIRGSAAVTA